MSCVTLKNSETNSLYLVDKLILDQWFDTLRARQMTELWCQQRFGEEVVVVVVVVVVDAFVDVVVAEILKLHLTEQQSQLLCLRGN